MLSIRLLLVIPAITTDRLVLRAVREDDAPAVQRLLSVPGIAPHVLSFSYPFPEGSALAWIRRDAARAQWSITLPGNDIIGAIGIAYHGDGSEAHIGYWVAVHVWNRGYATEAAREAIAYGLDHLGMRRIEAMCFPDNVASTRVPEKAGMVFERTLPAHVEKDGVPRDVSVYAIERSSPAIP